MSQPQQHTEPGGITDPSHLATAVEDLSYTFEGMFTAEQVEQAVLTAHRELADVSTVPDILPVLVARLARERLTAVAQAEGRIVKTVPELLFVCVHNAGRSQLAAALAAHLAPGKVHVRSAGSQPIGELNQAVVEVLAERGITLTDAYPQAAVGGRGPRGRCHRHHGLRRRLPGSAWQALPRLGCRRPRRSATRGGPRHPRRRAATSQRPAPRPQPLTHPWLRGDP